MDVSKIRGYMEKAGYSEVRKSALADVIFVSTCAVNQQYENDAVSAIKEAGVYARNGARVIVSGCFPRINPQRYGDVCDFEALPPLEMDNIEQMIPSATPMDAIDANTVTIGEYETNPFFMMGIRLKKLFRRINRILPFVKVPTWLDTVPMTDWFFIRGETGCTGKCTFCAIPRARGRVKSTPIPMILDQIKRAVDQGYKEICLAGDDMGPYGIDAATDLPTLLRNISELPGDFRINLRFFEPSWLIQYLEQLKPVLNMGRISSFSVPLQSGSQRILNAMKREHEIGEAVDAINSLVRETKLRSISSIAMVGFPGETTEDFKKTYDLLDSCDVEMYMVMKYEGRPGTPADAMEGQVPEEIKMKRFKRFNTRMKLQKFAGLPGKLAETLTTIVCGKIV